MRKPILQLVNINKTYDDGFTAVKDFNLTIDKGEFVTLLGPSGCGKTTMLKVIGGFEDPTRGKILYNGIDIKDMPITERPTSTVFQDYALFPNMTVLQNIEYGLKLMRTKLEDVPNNVYVEAEKIYKEAEKKSKKEIIDIGKKRAALKRDINKLHKKYDKDPTLKEISNMRRTEFLAHIDNLYEQLDEQYGEDYESKITFKVKFLDAFNALFSHLRIPYQFKVSSKNMNDIEKEIYTLKKWYRYKKPIDDKIDRLNEKYNDLDYWISYWENYPDIKKESFEKRNITRRLNKDEISERAHKVIKLVGLEGKEKNYPSDLSGGMQQRVALARSIVIEPEILLLDEPLGALDAKVRKQLQDEIKRLHEELGLTFILVTHDQEEALMLSDKIVVMSNGHVEQIGTPNDIYDSPINLWVANFVGRANILNGTYIGQSQVSFYDVVCDVAETSNFSINEEAKIMIRPEDFDVVVNGQGILNDVEVTNVTYKGLLYDIKCKYKEYILNVEAINKVDVGSIIGLTFDSEDVHLIKKEAEDIE
ncbi:ABC transporter ATP-binding protein [Ureaplasma ceti]|uniref:ATP-binding cassette domain-containing protein n=1 Tax=Ureaplasma ceti TaxID=3119530 RepID=A0ABP9U5N7_9BACT